MNILPKRSKSLLVTFLLTSVFLASCGSRVELTPSADNPSAFDAEIVTLLPKDAIPAIDTPGFYSGEAADVEYEEDELVIGVVFDNEARAYSIDLLSQHEIVNDMVRGHPIAVTW